MFLRHSFRAATLALCLAASSSGAATFGESQSPIDIITRDATYDAALPPLQFKYLHSPLTLVDTRADFANDENATVRAEVQAGSSLTIGGVEYSLVQFHLHAPGEHEFDGEVGAMELHLVHRAASGALAVVGQVIKIGSFNAALAPYFDALAKGLVTIPDFDLASLIPGNLTSYRYSGSLTAPAVGAEDAAAFLEPVEWNVFATPIEVSEDQFKTFKALFPEGNAREVQALNDRTVLTDVAPVPVPATGILFVFALGGLAAMRRRAA